MNYLKRLAISAEGFIFDPVTGSSFTTNETGLFIINALKEEKKEEEVVQMLAENFEVSKEEASRDLVDFIEQLRYYGLIG